MCAIVNRLFGLKINVALHSHGWEEKAYTVEQQLNPLDVHPKTTWKARMFRFPLLRLTLYMCNMCICGTIEEARWVQHKYPRLRHKIICIPNGVTLPIDTDPFWLCQPECPPYFLAIGNLTWKKHTAYAVQLFCEIIKINPLAKLYVIGCSQQELLEKAGIRKETGVVAIPQVSPADMQNWYTRCPYLFSCSRYEGGRSLAILESMTHGCIPFVSAIPSSMEIITDNKNGILLTTTSIENDAAKVITTLQSVDKIMLMRQNAFLYAQRQSWERQSRRLEKLLCKKI
jgi:glycosyltransferase involved in cell wall biosynthesis